MMLDHIWGSAFDSCGAFTHYFLTIHPNIKVILSQNTEANPFILWQVEIVADRDHEDGVIFKFHEQSIVAQNEDVAKHYAASIAWNWFTAMSEHIKGLIDE